MSECEICKEELTEEDTLSKYGICNNCKWEQEDEEYYKEENE